MDAIQQKFQTIWSKYFADAELPIVFFYADKNPDYPLVRKTSGHQCVIGNLVRVRRGETLAFNRDSTGCNGGKRYFGFQAEWSDDFTYFLSCGIPGKLEGERYKKTPELVEESMQYRPLFDAPGRYIIFKRWDHLESADQPEAVIFFAKPDVLSGLFTLTNFDEGEPNGVFAPFCAGCGSIVLYPYLENKSDRPRAVLGMCDVSARPYVEPDRLTFTIPWKKFTRMVANADQSFLITSSWNKVKKRI